MKFIKKFDEINENNVGGQDNYNLIKRIFSELKEEQVILFNTFEKYYICLIKKTDTTYKLYPVYVKDDIIRKSEESIFDIEKSNKYIDDDIILINDKEKKYYEFILIKNNMDKIRKFHQPTIESVTLSSEKDYIKYNKNIKTKTEDKRKIHQYKKEEIQSQKVIVDPREAILNKYKK